MNVRDNVIAPLIGTAIAAAILGSTFAIAGFMQTVSRGPVAMPQKHDGPNQRFDDSLVVSGQKLFLMNCAHCHAEDASGDEGPDLHGLRKTDERLRLLIKNGIKGEMPRFGEKLVDRDVDALVAFLDSLR
jgi:mono/diheme cytochrome c family protein